MTVKSGAYPVTETFALSANDSGTEQSPIVYRAESKGTVVLYGGARITDFCP